MKNILFIGDYFPLLSYSSAVNDSIAVSLYQHGFSIFLLSRAWCSVERGNFIGTVEELSNSAPFVRRYFIDPSQIKISGEDQITALFGLCCKIIEHDTIDSVLICDNLEFCLLAELLKARYSVECYLGIYLSSQVYIKPFTNYLLPFIKKTFLSFDRILTFEPYVGMLSNIVSKEILCAANPFDDFPVDKSTAVTQDSFFITGSVGSKKMIDQIAFQIERMSHHRRILLFLYGLYASNVTSTLVNNENIQIICPASLAELSCIPAGMCTLDINTLFGKPELLYTYFWQKKGYYPVVTSSFIEQYRCEMDMELLPDTNSGYIVIKRVTLNNRTYLAQYM